MINNESALRSSNLIYSLAELGQVAWWDRASYGLDETQVELARAVADEAADRLRLLYGERARRGWVTRRGLDLSQQAVSDASTAPPARGGDPLPDYDDGEDHRLWLEQNGKLIADMLRDRAWHPTLIWVGGYMYTHVGPAVRGVATQILQDLEVQDQPRPSWASEEILWQSLVALTNPQHASPSNIRLFRSVIAAEQVEPLAPRCRQLCSDFLEQEAELQAQRVPRLTT